MPKKGIVKLLLSIVFLAVLCAIALLALIRPTEHLSQADLRRLTVQQPFDVLITCKVHRQTGEAVYGEDAQVSALFAGCKPPGNFYIVAPPSTPEEACKTKNQPEVAFHLMESGEVKTLS
jgi:hypothetical protein